MVARKVPLKNLAGVLEERIKRRINRLAPGSPELIQALLRIGILLESETKLNIRRKRIIDTGTLLNSIRHELFKDGSRVGVKVGSFGVPYAAVHEFGFKGTVHVRGHQRRGAGVRGHARRVNIRARPYLRPAVKKHHGRIIEILRELLRGNN